MPRNVRNFWITVEVDGRQHNVETGPRAKDGGFIVRVYQRGAPDACSAPVLTVEGRADDAGRLRTNVWTRPNMAGQTLIGAINTERNGTDSVEIIRG